MNEQAIADVGRHITAKLQENLQRDVDIARHVLNSHEITLMLMKVAAGVVGAAAMVAMQVRRDETDPEELFDHFTGLMFALTKDLKPSYLEALATIEAGRSRAAERKP